MFPRGNNQKLLVAFCSVLLLLLLPIPCFADPYEQTYQLLDSPDGSNSYRLTVSITESLYEYYIDQSHLMPNFDFSLFVTPDALKPIADDLWMIYDNKVGCVSVKDFIPLLIEDTIVVFGDVFCICYGLELACVYFDVVPWVSSAKNYVSGFINVVYVS